MFNQHRAILLGLIVVQGTSLVAMDTDKKTDKKEVVKWQGEFNNNNTCHFKILEPKDEKFRNSFEKQATTPTVDTQNKTKNSLDYSKEAIQAALIVASQNQKSLSSSAEMQRRDLNGSRICCGLESRSTYTPSDKLPYYEEGKYSRYYPGANYNPFNFK